MTYFSTILIIVTCVYIIYLDIMILDQLFTNLIPFIVHDTVSSNNNIVLHTFFNQCFTMYDYNRCIFELDVLSYTIKQQFPYLII